MPWCSTCDRYLAPPTVTSGGACPTCGSAVESSNGPTATTPSRGAEPLPWHFKLLAVAIVVYLGFRSWQGVEWIVSR